jgi:autotransporter passenger strand-loop-strand repeat protein
VQFLGTEILSHGRSVSATISSGGIETVFSGGVTDIAFIKSGGLEVLSSGGNATSAVVSSGGYVVLLPGATDTTPVLSGGKVISTGVLIDAGGSGTFTYDAALASGTVLTKSGLEFVLSSGTASANTLSGGLQLVYSGGVAIADKVLNGASATIYSGGKASGTNLSSGGVLVVSSGGLASGTIVSSGGLLQLNSGGTASATTLGLDSFLLVASGGIAAGTVTFSGGGDLELQTNVMPTAVLSNFIKGDEVTLAALTYSSTYKAVVNTAGIVTISAGASKYNLSVAGATVGETSFTLTSGGGGTVLGTTASTQVVRMPFQRPELAAARGGFALPALHEVSVLALAAPHSGDLVAASAHPGWASVDLLSAVAHGGIQFALHPVSAGLL